MKKTAITALISSLLTFMAMKIVAARGGIDEKIVLENARVRITDRTFPVGVARDPFTRPTDEVVVFVDQSTYDRVDATSGKSDRITRKAGEVLFHHKGEHAPTLVNRGTKPFRSLLIELK